MEEFKIIALCDFRWRKDQTRMHKGSIVDVEENEILTVPEEISENDSLEMEKLGLIAFIDEDGNIIGETDDDNNDDDNGDNDEDDTSGDDVTDNDDDDELE